MCDGVGGGTGGGGAVKVSGKGSLIKPICYVK